MILKNLVVSTCLLSLFGNISFGDDTDTVPIGSIAPEASSVPDVVPGEVPVPPETPSSGGMDPTLRRVYLAMIPPTKTPIIADNGGFVISSIESFTVDIGISSCSFITRKNLLALLEKLEIPDPWVAQGDALDLIHFGKVNHTLTSFTDKNMIIPALNQRRADFFETVFDIYRYVPTRSRALQGHRVTVFLGEDEQWYILDTLDGEKTITPQLFSTYLAHDIDNAEWLVRMPGYSRVHSENTDLSMILGFLSPELQLFFHPEYLVQSTANVQQVVEHTTEVSETVSV